jgi:hypothetical protein
MGMKRTALVVSLIVGLGITTPALGASRSAKWKIRGNYQAKVHSTQLPALDGTWVLKFTPGHYLAVWDGKPEVQGIYSIKGNVITIHDTGGPAKCSGTGKYHFRFKLRGKRLIFKKISDPAPGCAGRVDVLKSRFTRVS